MAKKTIKPPHTDQHIIPKCYLKAWEDKTLLNEATNQPYKVPHIWIHDKSNSATDHFPVKTNFTQEDFYTVYDENGERDLAIEHALDKVEVKFNWIRDNKLLKNELLDVQEHREVCLFIATMHSRTVSRIEHFSNMFKPLQEKFESMMEFAKTASKDELKRMALSASDNSSKISSEELNQIVEHPLENVMVPVVDELANELLDLEFAVFCTKDSIGFITSDNPCVWYDSVIQNFQSPGLNSESIEIILPVSPSHCILLNKKIKGYIDVDTNPDTINQINQLIVEHSENKLISNSNSFMAT